MREVSSYSISPFCGDRIEFNRTDVEILKDIKNIVDHYFLTRTCHVEVTENGENEIVSFMNNILEILS